MTLLVTGGAGFIGANFVHDWLADDAEPVVNVDALTYAGIYESISSLQGDSRHVFVRGDICDRALVDDLIARHRPRAIVHLAAESHVDRSIHGPAVFIRTNIEGTFTLLEAARAYWQEMDGNARDGFRFLYVSTDEVYGSLAPSAAGFTEGHAYEPNSPYSATKAAGDHLVRAWHQTYGLPVLTTHGSDTYGPFQFPEKLIPLMLARALAGEPMPLYGDGLNVRDWLHVRDHCSAMRAVLARGRPGQVYNIGAGYEKTNLEVVQTLCTLLDELRPSAEGPYARLITFVRDRPGHDRRYAVDASKIRQELGWQPLHSFETGMRATVQWYLSRSDWLSHAQSGKYRDWVAEHYGRAVT